MASIEQLVASDGHRFDLRVTGDKSAPTVLFLPAMGVRASYYDDFADRLASRGLRVATCDLRGHGTSSIRPSRSSDFGYREILERDLPTAHRHLGSGPLSVAGHSLGGQLGLIYAGLTPIERVAVIACCVPDYRGFSGSFGFGVRVAGRLFPGLAAAAGYFPGNRIGFAGKESRGVIRDWAGSVRSGFYEPEWESALARVDVPVLAAEVAGDTWAPRDAIARLTNKCVRADVVEARVPCDGTRPHFAWVRELDPAVQTFAEFVGV